MLFFNLFESFFEGALQLVTFAERVRELRKAKGRTQKQMGDFLGLTERTYRAYEAGEVDPPSSKAIKLADYFDVSIDYLLGRSDDPAKR